VVSEHDSFPKRSPVIGLYGGLQALPVHVISDIINKVKDAKDLANCMATSKTMNEAVQDVRSLSLVCRKRYYDLARERFPIRRPCSIEDEEGDDDDETGSDDDSGDSEEEEEEATCEWSAAPQAEVCCGRAAPRHPNSSKQLPVHVSFKNACLNMLRHVRQVEQLRIEVDVEMQANLFQKEEIHMVDFWLSEPLFVRKWLSLCSHSLRHLTLVDYGQQAIMRQSPIVRVLSETCKPPLHLSFVKFCVKGSPIVKVLSETCKLLLHLCFVKFCVMAEIRFLMHVARSCRQGFAASGASQHVFGYKRL
jgi:hypothetical protein